jgi:hypothetical protein
MCKGQLTVPFGFGKGAALRKAFRTALVNSL